MKTKLFLTAILTIGLATFANARIFRMGYPGSPLTGVDYSDISALQAAATPGDTVQVYGNIGGLTITKPLVFIGFGYNLDTHAGLQKNNSNAPSSASLNFYPGSDGSKVEGLSGTFYVGNQTNSPVGAGVSNISFTRCNGTFKLFTLYSDVSDVTFTSCVLYNSGMNYSQGSSINIAAFNCIFGGASNGDFILYNPSSSAVFFNCVSPNFNYYNSNSPIAVTNANVLVRNCILAASNANNVNTVYENCFFGQSQPATLPLGTNNRWGQSWTNLFQGITGVGDEAGHPQNTAFNENYYILKTGSPAINGGFSGAGTPTNCGIFGGEAAFSYKLGGVPAVPSIYRLDAATLNASTNPYNVTISVRSNN